MKELNKEELLSIDGGSIAFNATLFTAMVKGATISFEIGRSLGTSIRMVIDKKYCTI